MTDQIKMTGELLRLIKEQGLAENEKLILAFDGSIRDYAFQLSEIAKVGNLYLAERILEAVDALIKEIPEVNSCMFTCKKGCSHCCNYSVDIYQEEAELIADYCATKRISIDKAYLVEQAKLSPQERLRSQTHSKCIFLKDNSCSIYPVRPVNCRKYLVISDAKYCEAVVRFGSSDKGAIYIDIDIEIFKSAMGRVLKPSQKMPEMLLKIMR